MSIRSELEKLVFYHKDAISGRICSSKEWEKQIAQANQAILAEVDRVIEEEIERVACGDYIDAGIRKNSLIFNIKAKLEKE